MNAKLILSIGIALLLVLVACQPQETFDAAAVQKAIEEANTMLAESMVQEDIAKGVAVYTEDAIILPQNGPMVKGRQNIQEWMEGFPKMGMKMVSIKFTTVSVEGKGSTAYEIGKYDQTFTIAGGPEMKDAGKYVAIWKKQQDGSWKLAVDIWNTDTPLPMPEPPKATAKKK